MKLASAIALATSLFGQHATARMVLRGDHEVVLYDRVVGRGPDFQKAFEDAAKDSQLKKSLLAMDAGKAEVTKLYGSHGFLEVNHRGDVFIGITDGTRREIKAVGMSVEQALSRAKAKEAAVCQQWTARRRMNEKPKHKKVTA